MAKKEEEVQIIVDTPVKKKKTSLVAPKKGGETEHIQMFEMDKKEPPKSVRVLMRENHKCCIGGEWYYLLADKHYNVPLQVKEILIRANKLMPL